MKTVMNKFWKLFFILGCVSLVFTACGDDDDPVNGGGDGGGSTTLDTTELLATIAECEAILAEATTDDYPEESMTTFQGVVDSAKEILESGDLTQQAVNNLIVQLNEAKNTFLGAAYGLIPEGALVIGLDFEEADPAELTTSGLRALTATLTAGPVEIFGTNTSLPTYVDGVNGGKAIHLANGSHLEIENYSPSDFLSSQLTIATWVKPDEIKAGNYIASLNYWNNWKFQLQEQSKPFFTFATTAGTADADNESDNSAPVGEWTHLVVTLDLTTQSLSFYVNGELTKTWDAEGKPALAGNMAPAYTSSLGVQLPFMIGAGTIYPEAEAAWDWDGWKSPESWDCLSGALDNFAIYNIALTQGQISKLYKEQKGN